MPARSARPIRAAILLAVATALASPAVGQEVPAETIPIPPDTLDVPVVVEAEPIPVDTLAFGLAPADTVPLLGPRFREGRGAEELAAVPGEDVLPKNPRNAAIRAFLLPGWGQVYTGHPWRAALFAAGELGFAALGYRKQQEALDKKAEIRQARGEFFADPPEGAPEDSLALEEEFQRSVTFRQLDAELEAIQERREDFYAWSIASIIFAAVDAYAAAQLDPIDVGVMPGDRRVWAALHLPVGRRPPGGPP